MDRVQCRGPTPCRTHAAVKYDPWCSASADRGRPPSCRCRFCCRLPPAAGPQTRQRRAPPPPRLFPRVALPLTSGRPPRPRAVCVYLQYRIAACTRSRAKSMASSCSSRRAPPSPTVLPRGASRALCGCGGGRPTLRRPWQPWTRTWRCPPASPCRHAPSAQHRPCSRAGSSPSPAARIWDAPPPPLPPLCGGRHGRPLPWTARLRGVQCV